MRSLAPIPLLVACLGLPLQGQDASERSGAWVAGGIGGAGVAVRMNGDLYGYSPAHTVPSFSVGAGLEVERGVRVGLEGFSWFHFTDRQTVESVLIVGLGARLAPDRASGLFVRASGGIGLYTLEWEDSWLSEWTDDSCGCDAALDRDAGLAWSVGVGFTQPVGRHLRLGPTVDLYYMHVGGPTGYRQRIVNIGLTFTYARND